MTLPAYLRHDFVWTVMVMRVPRNGELFFLCSGMVVIVRFWWQRFFRLRILERASNRWVFKCCTVSFSYRFFVSISPIYAGRTVPLPMAARSVWPAFRCVNSLRFLSR